MSAEVEPVVLQQLLGLLIVDRRPLQLEEQKLRLDLGGTLLHPLKQRAARRVGGIG